MLETSSNTTIPGLKGRLKKSLTSVQDLMAERVTAVDQLFVIYNALVMGLVLFFGESRSDFDTLLGWHLALFFVVALMVVAHKLFSGPVTRLIRLAYPAILLPFIHYESGLLSPMFTEGYLDAYFINLDRIIFSRDLYVWLAPNMGNFVINELMSGVYFSLYLLIFSLCLCTYIWRRQMMGELVFALTLCMYAHYLFFIIVPVIGPTGFRSELFAWQGGYLTSFVYRLIEQGDTAGGAFPSSHCAGTVLLNYYAGRLFGRRVAWLLAPITILICVSTVYLSMHYVVDSVAGILVGGFFAVYSVRLYQRLSRPRLKKAHALEPLEDLAEIA
jgi:membrane-associated phospholipid phosphatase